MMENQQWPLKYQQSGAGTDTTQDSLNNGEENGNAPTEETGEGAQEADKCNGNDSPSISEKATKIISMILDQVKELSNTEKYLLQLKLSQNSTVVDPLRQPLNPLGSRSEINRTISWIKTHLQEDPDTSLPKQEVYEDYSSYCFQNQIKSLSQADFGKVMKQVYPNVRARRLGTRGNSRYCYSGLRRCVKLNPPKLPDLTDKPLSTEAPCTQTSLTAAAWLIVKEWSELHFAVQFPSLQDLARFLVVNHAVGAGSEAANQLTSATESQLKGDGNSGRIGTKHREMQLQLQKKIQQKNEVKERKRKMQSPKSEPKASGKKSKARIESSPTLTCTGESSTSTSTGSTCTSPTQGKPICDKSLDFTQLPALPDFKSFQKPPIGAEQQQQLNSPTGPAPAAKVAIPRLSTTNKVQQQQRSPQSSPKKQVKNAKYKAIQPKPQLCDIASYNPQPPAADIRSQGVLQHNVGSFKERKGSDDDCDASGFPLPRERLDSIGNVDKDAMDEYLDSLGTNNSQHEEELSKYFSNNLEASDQENTTKLSQLRQLLEQNGIADNRNFSLIEDQSGATVTLPDPPSIEPLLQTVPYAVPTLPLSSNARRRVSFETPQHGDDTVPPSPNTRCKNFNFTPISPGPQSPNNINNNNNGMLSSSKCSSANVSPFVSPRNTPVPRSKNNTHQNAGIMRKKIKREPGLSVDIPVGEVKNCTMAMSAPASPMPTNESVLQKLLNSNSKVHYSPNYNNSAYSSIKEELPNEMKELLESGTIDTMGDLSYRSQSVPLNQMIKSNYTMDPQFLTNLSQNNAANEFNDFDPIPDTETVTVNRIIDSLDDQQCDSTANNIELYSVNQCLTNYNLIVNNNLDMQNNYNDNITYTPSQRILGRSQSIDVNGCYEVKCNNPSRSVPNTPLPFNQAKIPPAKTLSQISRSHPSTPLLVSVSPFNYNANRDCLLNGQPIRTNGVARDLAASDLNYVISNLNEINEDNNLDRHLTGEDDFNIGRTEFGIVENDNGLMDENGVLIGEPNYSGNINN